MKLLLFQVLRSAFQCNKLWHEASHLPKVQSVVCIMRWKRLQFHWSWFYARKVYFGMKVNLFVNLHEVEYAGYKLFIKKWMRFTYNLIQTWFTLVLMNLVWWYDPKSSAKVFHYLSFIQMFLNMKVKAFRNKFGVWMWNQSCDESRYHVWLPAP